MNTKIILESFMSTCVRPYLYLTNLIGGVMVSVLASSTVDRTSPDQVKPDYKIGI